MSNSSDKTEMMFRVITGRNPKTGGSLLRPVVTQRNTMNMRQLVSYAKTAGYVRGQTKDLEGTLGGFIQAMQDRALAGYSLNVNNWFIISGQLKGTVDESRLLTSANSYHVTITASKDLKADIGDFTWTNIDDKSLLMKVDSITSPNGVKDEITKTKAIIANGKNLSFHSDWGDKVIVNWMEGSEEKSAELVPSEQSETYLRFDWPTALADVPIDTELTFSFRLRAEELAAEQLSTHAATLVAAG